MRPVTIEAPAKINLRLRILAREEGGYHGLESLFCSVGLGDTVRVRRYRPGIHLRVSGGVEVGPDHENLAVRAARRFYAELAVQAPAVCIDLVKRIPAAAGLGGGSSDAAATLRALNALHGEPFPLATLRQWGGELGSDVAFFLCGSPLALAWSRGERLLALPPLPSRPVLIAHPGEDLPTPTAFADFSVSRGPYRPTPAVLALDDLRSWEGVATLAGNDFQEAAAATVPRTAQAVRLLRAAGAEIALLAGSGAAAFGVFAGVDACARAASPLRAAGFATWCTATRTAVPGSG